MIAFDIFLMDWFLIITIGEIMAGIFHSQISFNEHASLKKKNQRRKEKGNMEKNHIYHFVRPSMSECF